MTIAFDPVSSAALADAIGHPPPYSDDELRALRELRVTGASDTAWLSRCSGLRRLDVSFSNLSLDVTAAMNDLEVLSVNGCEIADIAALAACRNLAAIDLSWTPVEDAAPLSQMPRLRSARLVGVPLSEESYRRLRDPSQRVAGGAPYAVELPAEHDWRLSRALRERGLRLAFGRMDGMRPVLVQYGPGADRWFRATNSDIEERLERSLTETDAFVASFSERPSGFDLTFHREIGAGDAATAWIESSSLIEVRSRGLGRLIAKFPSLTFFREDAAVLDWFASYREVELPNWLREVRQVLAFVEPNQSAAVQFDAFDHETPRSRSLPDLWYSIGLQGYADDEDRELLHDRCDVFPIGSLVSAGRSMLAARLDDPHDARIYEFHHEDLWDAEADGESPKRSIRVAFNSYASMLGHITAVRLPSGQVIQASRP